MAIFDLSKFIPVFLGKIVGKYLEWPFLGILNLYQSFWGKLSEKIQNGHFWSFQIYTSLFGKNFQKKFRQPFLAILNLCQSFWKELSEKIQNSLFGHSKFLCIFRKNCCKKFGMAIFCHSEFIPVFLGKIVGKYLEWPFLGILNLYQSFWGKLSEKIQNGHFWPFQIYTSLLGKNGQKNLEKLFLDILNFF